MKRSSPSGSSSLSPDANRILFIRNLPWKITTEEMFDIFGKYGSIRQIRMGESTNSSTRGTAYVVYDDIFDAKSAVENLTGFNIGGRYIIVLYHQQIHVYNKKKGGAIEKKARMLEEMKKKHGVE